LKKDGGVDGVGRFGLNLCFVFVRLVFGLSIMVAVSCSHSVYKYVCVGFVKSGNKKRKSERREEAERGEPLRGSPPPPQKCSVCLEMCNSCICICLWKD